MADPKRIVFGSLEEQERARQEQAAKGGEVGPLGNQAIEAAIRAGNINIADAGTTQVLELTDTSKEAQERHAQLLKKLEAEKRKRVLYVPTNPQEVIDKLREMKEPITLFGERVADRRERLREILATKDLEQETERKAEGLLGVAPAGVVVDAQAAASLLPRSVAVKGGEGAAQMDVDRPAEGGEAKKAELFYTVGGAELVEARKAMADFSFKRAPERLQALKRKREAYKDGREGTEEARRMEAETGKLYDRMRRLDINQSQLGDDRPLGAIRINPAGDLVATGSWTNVVKVWDLSGNLEELTCFVGHTERISHVAWKPETDASSGMEVEGKAKLRGFLASASVDGTAKLWDVASKQAVQTFTGHAARLAQVEFHPCGRFIGTTSWDYTWRLWDVETGQELMLQDGHHKETHAITFHPDGALVVTGDYSGVGHVWDLRSGKSIWVLQGHTNKIVCADFHPNGYQVATGSGENMVKLWDLRRKKNYYTLPAHTSLISSVRFAPCSGEFLATASFDGHAKVWGTRDFRLLKQLSGHEGRLVGIDVSPDETKIVTASHDRTFKLWAEME